MADRPPSKAYRIFCFRRGNCKKNFDESGDYTVRPFQFEVRESVDNDFKGEQTKVFSKVKLLQMMAEHLMNLYLLFVYHQAKHL